MKKTLIPILVLSLLVLPHAFINADSKESPRNNKERNKVEILQNIKTAENEVDEATNSTEEQNKDQVVTTTNTETTDSEENLNEENTGDENNEENLDEENNDAEDTNDEDTDNNKKNKNKKAVNPIAEQRRSVVANAVREMLQVADRNGGIGQQIRVVAQTQTQNQEKIENSLEKIQNRSKFAKFFVGPNYEEIKNTQEVLDQNKQQIEELNQTKTQITDETDLETINQQIKALEQTNSELESSLQETEKGFSLFGWMFKMFAKK